MLHISGTSGPLSSASRVSFCLFQSHTPESNSWLFPVVFVFVFQMSVLTFTRVPPLVPLLSLQFVLPNVTSHSQSLAANIPIHQRGQRITNPTCFGSFNDSFPLHSQPPVCTVRAYLSLRPSYCGLSPPPGSSLRQ